MPQGRRTEGRRFFEPQGVQGHCQLSGRSLDEIISGPETFWSFWYHHFFSIPIFSEKSLVVVELNYLKLSNTKITGSTELTVQVRSSARWGLGWSPGGTAEFSHRMNGLNGCPGQAVQELGRSVCPPQKGEHDEWYYMVSPRTTRISPFLV